MTLEKFANAQEMLGKISYFRSMASKVVRGSNTIINQNLVPGQGDMDQRSVAGFGKSLSTAIEEAIEIVLQEEIRKCEEAFLGL